MGSNLILIPVLNQTQIAFADIYFCSRSVHLFANKLLETMHTGITNIPPAAATKNKNQFQKWRMNIMYSIFAYYLHLYLVFSLHTSHHPQCLCVAMHSIRIANF